MPHQVASIHLPEKHQDPLGTLFDNRRTRDEVMNSSLPSLKDTKLMSNKISKKKTRKYESKESQLFKRKFKKMGLLTKNEKRKIATKAFERLYSPNISKENEDMAPEEEGRIKTRNQRFLHHSIDFEYKKSITKEESIQPSHKRMDSLLNPSLFIKSPQAAFKGDKSFQRRRDLDFKKKSKTSYQKMISKISQGSTAFMTKKTYKGQMTALNTKNSISYTPAYKKNYSNTRKDTSASKFSNESNNKDIQSIIPEEANPIRVGAREGTSFTKSSDSHIAGAPNPQNSFKRSTKMQIKKTKFGTISNLKALKMPKKPLNNSRMQNKANSKFKNLSFLPGDGRSKEGIHNTSSNLSTKKEPKITQNHWKTAKKTMLQHNEVTTQSYKINLNKPASPENYEKRKFSKPPNNTSSKTNSKGRRDRSGSKNHLNPKKIGKNTSKSRTSKAVKPSLYSNNMEDSVSSHSENPSINSVEKPMMESNQSEGPISTPEKQGFKQSNEPKEETQDMLKLKEEKSFGSLDEESEDDPAKNPKEKENNIFHNTEPFSATLAKNLDLKEISKPEIENLLDKNEDFSRIKSEEMESESAGFGTETQNI